ncbi:MAG: hypothetical protein WCQ50_15930 [Spirochaetota bacterium]
MPNPVKNGFTVAIVSKGRQYLSTNTSANSYAPIAVQRGIPVRWAIHASEEVLSACNEKFAAPELGISARLLGGDTIVEFTPQLSGEYGYSCWMGMIKSSILVVDDIALPLPTTAALQRISLGSSGPVPTSEMVAARMDGPIQRVELRVEADGFHPAILVLQRGKAATISIVPGPGLTEERTIIEFPGHEARIDVSSAAHDARFPEVMADFTFRNASGKALGYVKVVDDIGDFDRAAVRQEVARYRPADAVLAPCCGY